MRFPSKLNKDENFKTILMIENDISEIIIGCCIEVHKSLGPGLLESAYQECLFYELQKAGLNVEKQKSLPLIYKEVKLDAGYRVRRVRRDCAKNRREIIILLNQMNEFNQIR